MNRKIIDARQSGTLLNFKELYQYRDLFLTLTWRDFRVRYAQTTVGLLWALVQPVLTVLILSLVFGRFIGVETAVPHLLFTVAGSCLWTYFAYVMSNSGNSIVASQEMVKKIYFPRLIIPVSKAAVGFIDFGICILILIFLLFYYGIVPNSTAPMALVFILMGIVAALGVGIWLSALTVRYRDFQHVIPFLVQIGLYITPIAYPAEFATRQMPDWAAKIYYLNPMTGVIQGFRWSLFGGTPPGNYIYITAITILAIFISGLWYFKRVESEMADYV